MAAAVVTVNELVYTADPAKEIVDVTLATTGDWYYSKFGRVKGVTITPHGTWGADDYIYWSQSAGKITFTAGGTNAATGTYSIVIYG